MATLAVFIALGGGALAASKIGASDIKRNAVHARHIKAGVVNSAKLADGAVHASNLGKIITVKSTVTIPNNSQDQTGAFCPDGTRRIGGGAAAGVFGMPISGSRPDAGGTAWDGFARNDTGVPVDLTVYALCLKG